ncbi:hypothetical protein V1508DRAFT_168037 [Lipomyces doorenjongii]|uniref:uncharacterized protein n=1 Tax=Lipomyces doorenjongii TaxID=383834 RepID=UPI0034CFA3A5
MSGKRIDGTADPDGFNIRPNAARAWSSKLSFLVKVRRRQTFWRSHVADPDSPSKHGKRVSLASKIASLFFKQKDEVLPKCKQPQSLIRESHAYVSSPIFSNPSNSPIGADTSVDNVSSDIDSAPALTDVKVAQDLFTGDKDVVEIIEFTSRLGDPHRREARTAYMSNFNWTGKSILSGLRSLCERIYFRGEAQHIDRILDAFATRWCECNPNHGFQSKDVVYTLAYSILLLNTDHHWTDISSQKKLTRQQFVTNTLCTVLGQLDLSKDTPEINIIPAAISSDIQRVLSVSSVADDNSFVSGGPPLSDRKAWISTMEGMLRNLYLTISKQPLSLNDSCGTPLDDAAGDCILDDNILLALPYITRSATTSLRSSSALRKYRTASASSSSRPKLTVHHSSSLTDLRGSIAGNSRTYFYEANSSIITNNSSQIFDDAKAYWRASNAASLSSAWSYQESIRDVPVGLAGAVSQMMIKEETVPQLNPASSPDGSGSITRTMSAASKFSLSNLPTATQGGKLIDEELEIRGAPWAKEGLVKYRRQLDRQNKKAKTQTWEDTFVVVQRGYLKTFQFFSRQVHRNSVVGGGNWTESATMRDCIRLNQTVASYISGNGMTIWKRKDSLRSDDIRTWVLTLSDGSEHIFESGTAEIADEFVDTCNYWAARLSKEPLQGAVSNIEYGWSGNALSMLRSGYSSKHRSPASLIREWKEPPLNLILSGLDEASQLNSLLIHIGILEQHIEEHSQAKKDVIDKLPNGQLITYRATSNWHRKSLYLKKELAKYKRYVEVLRVSLSAQETLQQ